MTLQAKQREARQRAVLFLTIGLAAGPLAPVRAAEQTAPTATDLSGRYALNKELSDDAREKMRDAMEKGGGRGAMRSLLEPAEEIVVSQTPSEVVIEEVFGRVRRVRPDGRKYKTDNGNGEIRSYWKDGKLRVETRGPRGAVVAETWERVPDGSRLIVMVRVEGGPGGKLELKRIYDVAPGTATSLR